MDEKRRIEQATAQGFLNLYNDDFGSSYEIEALGDAPDVRCRDSDGSELNLEITVTEDRPRDIQALMGRSGHKDIEMLVEQRHLKGLAEPDCTSNFEALEQVAERIKSKLKNSYGTNAALVVRDASPLDWDWNEVMDDLRGRLCLESKNPFDKGIWIINRAKTKLYRVTS